MIIHVVTSITFLFSSGKLKKIKHLIQEAVLAPLNNGNVVMLLFECTFNKNYG